MVIADEITLGQWSRLQLTRYDGLAALGIGWFFNLIERGKASYERIEDIMNTASDIDDAATTDRLPSGNITFDIDRFAFPVKMKYRSRYSFYFKRGRDFRYCHTRVRKKFTYQLLLREFDTQTTIVRVNDIDIKQYDIKS